MALRLLRLVPVSATSRGLAAVVQRVVRRRRAEAAGGTWLVLVAPPLPHLPGPPGVILGGDPTVPWRVLSSVARVGLGRAVASFSRSFSLSSEQNVGPGGE